MKKSTTLNILFLALVLSSCGLIEKFKTPEQPTDTIAEEKPTNSSSETDDLFSQTASEVNSKDADDIFNNSMNENKTTATDAPTNVESDLKSLEDEFSANGPRESVIKEGAASETPVVVQETIPEIKEEAIQTSPEAGTVQIYKVQRGETLMQIAFKLYGDIGKWKDLKAMNRDKLANNTSLKANSELKYRAPETPFVWNPEGAPYMIKNGETLGIISNNVYSTPKKWKSIWENNKPLIKNPNVIFAGFTLYYKKSSNMANYVQPAAAQPKKAAAEKASSKVEEIEIEKLIDEKIDEAQQVQSAPEREDEIDLINNVSAPLKEDTNSDLPPIIDEEIHAMD